MDSEGSKPAVLFLGKLPPPYIGPAIAARVILSSRLNDHYRLIHLDMSDHRDTHTLGRWDLTNIFLALKQYFRLVCLILRHKPDLVYIPAGQTSVGYLRDAGFILLSKLLGRRVICHLRGGNFLPWYRSAPPLVRAVVRFTHAKVDGQIVLADNLRPLFNWILPEERIFTVPNGLNRDRPLRETRSGPLRLLYLSNYIRSKGVMEVLEAIRQLHSEGEAVECTLAGGWNEPDTEKEIRAFLSRYGSLPLNVLGPVSGGEKDSLLGSADVFLLPSYYVNEGLPWALVEAMASGLPLLATRHAAIPSCLEEGVNGFFVGKASSESLAEGIRTFLRDPGLVTKMGEASRRRYEAGFTEEAMVEGLHRAFQATLKR